MRIVENSELNNYKVLPFDLYSENKLKIMEAGEVLTPGKLIMLKNHLKIFAEDFHNDEEFYNEQNASSSKNNPSKILNFSYDALDVSDFDTVMNKNSCLKTETQVKIKYYYKLLLEILSKGYYSEAVVKLQGLVSIIENEIFKHIHRSEKGSQVRFMGEYELCHPLNVAIVSGLIGRKLEYSNRSIDELILSALIHDIGKLEIKLPGSQSLLTINESEVKAHPILGYKIIKEKMKLNESIAKVALEHHESNDGSGYPQGISNDFITEYSQIVNVANYYDNLAFNRTHVLVTNNKEAMRAMLEAGTKKFSAKILYTFIHMFNYDDLKDFNDMII